MRKYGYITILIIVFAMVQPTILFSFNASIIMPDLVAILVAALSFSRTLRLSCTLAIFAGIVVDLTSPAIGIFGLSVVSYLLIALVINFTVQAPHQTTWLPVAASGISPALAVTIRAVLVTIISGVNLTAFYPTVLFWQLLVGVIAAAFLVPAIDWVDRPLYEESIPLRVRS